VERVSHLLYNIYYKNATIRILNDLTVMLDWLLVTWVIYKFFIIIKCFNSLFKMISFLSKVKIKKVS
jgi:hypothetical protein